MYYCDFHVRLYNSNIDSKIYVERVNNDDLPIYCKVKPNINLGYEPTVARESARDLEKVFFTRNGLVY